MTEILHEIEAMVAKVHIVKDDTKEIVKPRQPKEIRSTYRTFSLSNTSDPVMLLGHAPNRVQAILQFTAAGPIILGSDRATVLRQGSDSTQINVAAAGIIVLKGTNEVWATSTVAGVTNAAVIAEYEETNP